MLSKSGLPPTVEVSTNHRPHVRLGGIDVDSCSVS